MADEWANRLFDAKSTNELKLLSSHAHILKMYASASGAILLLLEYYTYVQNKSNSIKLET